MRVDQSNLRRVTAPPPRFPVVRHSRTSFEVWFVAEGCARTAQVARRIASLAEPEFAVHELAPTVLGPQRGMAGRRRSYWHCRLEARREEDNFAILRFLKMLTGAGYQVLSFDTAIAE